MSKPAQDIFPADQPASKQDITALKQDMADLESALNTKLDKIIELLSSHVASTDKRLNSLEEK